MNSTFKNIILFTKIEHTIFSLPLILTGSWLGMNRSSPDLVSMALIIIASFGARIFGITLNRIFDRNIDAMNPRTSNRELPAKKMSVECALIVGCSGLFLYIASCSALGRLCLLLSPIPLLPLIFYSFLKRFTVLCHFGIGICLAIAPLSAFIATSGCVVFSTPVVMFSFFVFCWLSGADIIYASMDIKNDRINGVYSLPAKLGEMRAQLVAVCMHIMAITVIGLIILLLDGGFLSWFSFFVSMFFFFLMYVPSIPISARFFPLSSFAGISGSVALILA